MRLLTATLVALLGLAVAQRALPARAQALQRLTVESFVLSTDTAAPQLDVPFRLVVTLRVRERVTQIDNLELPILAELELLGDERTIQSGPNGTVYAETISVVAHRGGAIAIGPAMLQAVDARDRRAKQFSTNGLTLDVRGGAAGENVPAEIASTALRLTLWTGGVVCAIVVLVLVFRRRSRGAPPVAPVPVAPAAPAAPERSANDAVCDALTVLRAEPTRATAVRVRALLWRMMGAEEGETLSDVLARQGAREPRARDALRGLERAAFTYDEDLAAAIAEATIALERFVREPA